MQSHKMSYKDCMDIDIVDYIDYLEFDMVRCPANPELDYQS